MLYIFLEIMFSTTILFRSKEMKATFFKNVNMAALVIIAIVNAQVSLADGPINGSLTAGNANIAPTDVYRLACPAGTATVRARVTNPNGNPADEITVQVIAPATGRARSAISLEGIAPPTAILAGGAGNYLVTVHKDSTLIASRYSISLDCYTTIAAIAGNQTVMLQNQ
jgi:hypothetical protein